MWYSFSGIRHALAMLILLDAAQSLRAQSVCSVPSEALAIIDRANADWLPAMRSHDVDRVVAPYDSAAVFVTTDGTSIKGRESIAAMYRSRFLHMAKISGGGVIRDGSCAVSDSLVYEWGHAQLELAEAGAAAKESTGRYLTVWQRTRAGTWVIVRNIVL
jgi:ketosteroid isomerase-like protein